MKSVIETVENLAIPPKLVSTTKLTKILLADSKKKSDGYWNNNSIELAQQLFSPSFSPTPALTYPITQRSVVSTQSHSVLKTNISYESDKVVKSEITVAWKFQIIPNDAQRKLFIQSCGAHRFFYNQTVDYLSTLSEGESADSYYTIRSMILHSHLPDWCDSIHFAIKAYAIELALIMHKSAVQNFWRHGQKYKMEHLALSNKDQMFKLAAHDVKKMKWINSERNITMKKAIFPRKLKADKFLIFKRKEDEKEFFHLKYRDFTIQKTGSSWHIIMPQFRKTEVIKNRKSIVALDPGIRTFQTFYSAEEHGKLGDHFTDGYQYYNSRIDTLVEVQKGKISRRKRRNIARRLDKLRTKISSTTREMHIKTARWLTSNYDNIIIPNFSTKQIAMKSQNHKMNRAMYQLSHFSFRQKLNHYCQIRNCNMMLASEAHTTMTCGKCGNLNRNVGSAKIYQCGKCDYVADRDISAARNILIRSLTKYWDENLSRKNIDPVAIKAMGMPDI